MTFRTLHLSRLFISLSGLLSIILLSLPAVSVNLPLSESTEVFNPEESELGGGEGTLALPNGSKQRSRRQQQTVQWVLMASRAATSNRSVAQTQQRSAAGLLSLCGCCQPLLC